MTYNGSATFVPLEKARETPGEVHQASYSEKEARRRSEQQRSTQAAETVGYASRDTKRCG